MKITYEVDISEIVNNAKAKIQDKELLEIIKG